MSLFIGFVLVSITAEYMVESFYDTFGAEVYVSFGPVRSNHYGVSYKPAIIEVTNSTRAMDQFMSEIYKYGSNTFNHTKKDSWKVQIKQENEPVLMKVKPRIVF
jgi:hypothetical protein